MGAQREGHLPGPRVVPGHRALAGVWGREQGRDRSCCDAHTAVSEFRLGEESDRYDFRTQMLRGFGMSLTVITAFQIDVFCILSVLWIEVFLTQDVRFESGFTAGLSESKIVN